MIFGIVGLGLIGGSLARSIKFHSKHTVYSCDLKEMAILQAKMVGAIDGELTDEKRVRRASLRLPVTEALSSFQPPLSFR